MTDDEKTREVDATQEIEVPERLADLNPGIRRVVGLLWAHGFHTCDSGDGETHEFECDRDHGYVSIVVDPERMLEETTRLVALLRQHGIKILPVGTGYASADATAPTGGVWVQASYDPADGLVAPAVIDVSFIHDRMLPEVLCVN